MNRLKQLAMHLHMRARINETIRDGEPVDYAQIRQWAPMLREAAEALDRCAEAVDAAQEKP